MPGDVDSQSGSKRLRAKTVYKELENHSPGILPTRHRPRPCPVMMMICVSGLRFRDSRPSSKPSSSPLDRSCLRNRSRSVIHEDSPPGGAGMSPVRVTPQPIRRRARRARPRDSALLRPRFAPHAGAPRSADAWPGSDGNAHRALASRLTFDSDMGTD